MARPKFYHYKTTAVKFEDRSIRLESSELFYYTSKTLYEANK